MEDNHEIHKGRIEDVGLLNLLYAKTPEDLAGIQSIEDVGCILIPEHLGGVLARISMEDVGTIVPVPQDGKVNLVAGQGRFTGEAIAQGDPETLLVIAGQAMITSVVEKVGFRGIFVAGQIFAPTGSEAALTTAMTTLMGQVFYYKAGARMFQGHDRIGRDFLELVDTPIAIVITGHLEIDDDVTLDLLKAKVSEIALYGHLEVPRALYALAQFLTVEKSGHIEARG
jgi:hypothetical protein